MLILNFPCFPPTMHISHIEKFAIKMFYISTCLSSQQAFNSTCFFCLNITFLCCDFLPNMPFMSACPSPQHVFHPNMFPAQHDPHLSMFSNFIRYGRILGGSLSTSFLVWSYNFSHQQKHHLPWCISSLC